MIIHNSYLAEFRQPFGALAYGSQVTLALHTEGAYQGARVTLRLWQNSHGERLMPMQTDSQGIKHTATLDTSELSMELLWYYFIIEHNEQIIYYGNNIEQLGGIGQINTTEPPSYQITLYQANQSIPTWFTKGIIYQIFPDRFYRNPTDSLPQIRPNCLIHSDWSDTPLYVLDANSGEKVDLDYFGGTLKGIMKKLPYLQDLGVSIIYLNPIFEAASNHRYNTADYLKVDSLLGTNEDFAKLCARAAEYDIRIILDGVFSHTGSDSIYFNKEGNYPTLGAYQSTESPYYDWFDFKQYPDNYTCWWGVPTLPNTNEHSPSFQNFIINNPGSVLKYWLSLGASGWRLDVADELPLGFLRNFYQTLKNTATDSVLIGEVWEDASNKVSYGELRNYLDGFTMDSVMNYPLREIFLGFILQNKSAEKTAALLMNLYENYPRRNFYALMNLVGSHDRPRILSLLGQALRGSRQATPLLDEQLELAVKRLQLLTLWQMTFPGVPSIYYGDEVGVQGGTDPYNRSGYPWGQENLELLNYFKQLTALRNSHQVLVDGDWQIEYAHKQVLAYSRTLEAQRILVVLNVGEQVAQLSIDLDCQQLINMLDGNQQPIADNKLVLDIAPISGQIYQLK